MSAISILVVIFTSIIAIVWIVEREQTKRERNKIEEIANRFDVGKVDVANMFQKGISFKEIINTLELDKKQEKDFIENLKKQNEL